MKAHEFELMMVAKMEAYLAEAENTEDLECNYAWLALP